MTLIAPDTLATAAETLRTQANRLREEAATADRLAAAFERRATHRMTTIVCADELVPGDVWLMPDGGEARVSMNGRCSHDLRRVEWDLGDDDPLPSIYSDTVTFTVSVPRPPLDADYSEVGF